MSFFCANLDFIVPEARRSRENLRKSRSRSQKFEPEMKKILIIKPSSLGDILHALQIVESLRNQLGNDNSAGKKIFGNDFAFGEKIEISWVVREIFAPLLENCSSVDKVFIYQRKRGIRGICELGKTLKKEKFDLVLDLQGLARSAFWALCTTAKRKIGRGDGREFSRFAFKELAGTPPNGFANSHAVEILLQFLPKLGIAPEIRGKVAFPSSKISPKIAEKLAGKNPPILLFPDSRRPEKEWKFFPELTKLLLENAPETPVVWCGQSDLKPNSEILAFPSFLDFSKKTSLEELPALVSKAKFCVTNDSGPLHLAAAMDVPVLGIFGPTSPILYGPFPRERATNRTICAPEGDLKKLSPEKVFEECKKFFVPADAKSA